MQTGRQTLGTIEGALSKLHGEESRIDAALQSAVAEGERLRAERTAALKELARVKLDEMTAGRLVRNLDAAERRAVQVLEDRRHRIASIAERRAQAVAATERDEAARHIAGQTVETALAAVEAIRADSEAEAQATPAWRGVRARFEAADKIAVEAERKAQQSETELGAKQRPYDQDPLFKYLWERHYATGRYAAGNIARLIDGRVASFIGFHGARANYAMLREIPVRLRQHATDQRAIAAEVAAELGAIERQAMVTAGIEPKERALAEARHKLAAAEAALDARRRELQGIEQQRDALLGGSGDPAYAEALETIAAGDAKDDIATLWREARRTPTDADEALVRRIEQTDTRLDAADREAAELRGTARDLAKRRLEVESVRERFRGAGYDHPHATFGNDNQIGTILGQILEGVVRSGILWDVIRDGFGTRPARGRAGFGQPGFPFPFPMPGGGSDGARGGEWREPGTRGGWFPPSGGGGGGSGGGSSGSGDDSFSTGGSI